MGLYKQSLNPYTYFFTCEVKTEKVKKILLNLIIEFRFLNLRSVNILMELIPFMY
jgi:hypothetical protein